MYILKKISLNVKSLFALITHFSSTNVRLSHLHEWIKGTSLTKTNMAFIKILESRLSSF